MTTWFTSPENTPRKWIPCEAFVTFVAKNYKPPARFLDIGSGWGANSRYLEDNGFEVFSIDIAPESRGARFHAIADISEIKNGELCQFDCIFDIETLQHVENPPYEAIHRALKPGGKFFSIHASHNTRVSMAGKGYTRLTNYTEMQAFLLAADFKDISIRERINWSGATKIVDWQIEACK